MKKTSSIIVLMILFLSLSVNLFFMVGGYYENMELIPDGIQMSDPIFDPDCPTSRSGDYEARVIVSSNLPATDLYFEKRSAIDTQYIENGHLVVNFLPEQLDTFFLSAKGYKSLPIPKPDRIKSQTISKINVLLVEVSSDKETNIEEHFVSSKHLLIIFVVICLLLVVCLVCYMRKKEPVYFVQEVNGVRFDMIPIIGGSFVMGSQAGDKEAYDDEKLHRVRLNSFSISRTLVTQRLWNAVMNINYPRGSNLPVTNVNREQVKKFLTKLNKLTKRNYQLPDECQWEYAARGGRISKGYKYSGSNTIDDVAWYKKNSQGKCQPVATKDPNELGIYDMSGNVWEFCQDRYVSDKSTGISFVQRGGGFNNEDRDCRSRNRYSTVDGHKNNDLGFRIVLTY